MKTRLFPRVHRVMRATAVVCALTTSVLAGVASAQTPPVAQPPGARRNAQTRDAQGRDPQGQRALMERRIQDRIDAIVRTRLALSDEQVTQLRAVSTRMEATRRELRREEMTVRTELRRQLLATDTPDESRIAELLDQMPKLERRRIDMLDQEQRELARFLQPSQRARYFALQDELRRNLQEGQRRRMGADEPPPVGAALRGRNGQAARLRPPLVPPAPSAGSPPPSR